MKLDQLYQEIILEHNRSPHNFHKMEGTTSIEAYNPLCGDRYTIYLEVKNNIVTRLSFTGEGCALSKASASIMTSMVEGTKIEKAKKMIEDLQRVAKGETLSEDLEEMLALSSVHKYPSRIKCVTLPWHGLKNLVIKRQEI